MNKDHNDIPPKTSLPNGERRFRWLIEQNADGILVVDNEGLVRFANHAAERLLGRNVAELVGTTFGFPMAAGQITEIDLLRPDGTTAVAEMHVTTSEWDGQPVFLATLRDITARKQAEAEVRFQAQLLNAVEQGIAATDLTGTITFWNRFAETLCGWPAAATLGRNIREILPAPGAEASFELALSEPQAGGSWHGELQVRRQDGSAFPALVLASPIHQDGGITGIVYAFTDITERKQIEETMSFLVRCGATSGEDFFRSLARYLAEQTGMEYVFINHLENNAQTARTIVFYCDGRFEDNVSYSLSGTPCGQVVGQTICCFPKNVQRLFPEDEMLQQIQAESYAGVLLYTHTGQPAGLIAAVSRRPLADCRRAVMLLQLVAARAVGELERQLAEQELRNSEQRYRSITEQMREMVFTTDAQGVITYVSPAALCLFGASPEEMVGQHFTAFLTAEAIAQATAAFASDLDKGQARSGLILQMKRRDGATFYGELSAGPFASNDTRGTLGLIRDVTAQVQAEARLQRYAAELERSNRELQQFAYIISHDLQEPLRTVGSFTRLLAERYRGRLDREADEFIAFITDGVSRMQELLQSLLEYSRVGSRARQPLPTEAQAALDRALASLRTAIIESKAEITYDPLPIVWADPVQLVQLFQNLISNALKFRGTEPPRVHIWAERRDGEWLLAVRDNGIGIAPQYHEKIFEPFRRLHTREEYPGSGLGLTICQKIVKRHGGRIWVESTPGAGATFYFTLPDGPAEESVH